MSGHPEFEIRWLGVGDKIRQVYALPPAIPWPMEAQAVSPDDSFLNISALGAAAEVAGLNGDDKMWEGISNFCRLCEEVGGEMENFEYANALDLLSEASEAHECAFVHWQRCICHLELKQPEQALAAAYHATSMAPQCAVFWRVFGELCQDRGMPKEAHDAFERAFFGGEQSPSVIAAMKSSGMLVQSPGGGEGVLVSPAVAGAILEVHIATVAGRKGSKPRLRELARMCLDHKSTARIAKGATSLLVVAGDVGDGDLLMHAESLWAWGEHQEGRMLVEKVSRKSTQPVSARLLSLSRKMSPRTFEVLRKKISRDKNPDKAAVREIFRSGKLSDLEDFAERNPSAGAMIVLAEELSKAKRRKEAVEMANKACQLQDDVELREEAAKLMVENREYEKACALISKTPEGERGGFSSFIFGEALWQMGFADLALPQFSKAAGAGLDDALTQNALMREAQCKGFLLPLDEPATLSPTKRLGRAILVSSHEQEWTSVVAPAGLPSSSYVRVKTDKSLKPGTYRVFEFSRNGGEILIGEFSTKESHDELAVAIEPSGKIFMGAKRGGDWIESCSGAEQY